MIQVTEEALEKLKELLSAEGSEQSAIRIAVMGGGGQGPGLGLVIDEAKDDDKLYDVNRVPVIIEGNLIEYCQSITIDFTVDDKGRCGGASGSGFIIVADNPVTF